MADRLVQIDQNVHDSVVDITNYITHDLGHPCHAFDYDKIMELGGEIIITQAKPGLPFTTLDGEAYETTGREIVFVNPEGTIIDLPGIKGTANSSISEETSRVLLWIESIEPRLVRTASMTHAIRTVAAQLNEKNVDPNLGDDVLAKGVELYTELCSATVASEVFDEFPGQEKTASVTISAIKIEQYLGISLKTAEITTILETLGCTVDVRKEPLTFTVHPPTFRPDLTIPADIIEEIARIYGYHNIPSTLMDTPIPTTQPEDTNFTLEHTTKQFLAARGFQELYTYSLVSEEIAAESGYAPEDHLKLQNPLTDDRVYLRRSLIPSLSEIITQNSREKLSVFELANTYQPTETKLPTEELQLTIVSNEPYRQAKGALEALLEKLYIPSWSIEPSDSHPSLKQSGEIHVKLPDSKKAITLGSIGILKNGWFAAELAWKQILKVSQGHPAYEPIPKTAPIFEDFTFVIPDRTHVGDILATAHKADTLITNALLLDQYRDSITIRVTYHDPLKSLSSESVEPTRKKLVKTIEESYNATLKGTV